MEFSDKQREVLKTAVNDTPMVLCGGSVRSGKSFATDLAFCIFCINECMGYDTAIVGVSIESIMRNVGFDIITLFNELGATAELNRALGTRIKVEFEGRECSVWIIGSSDTRSRKRIQGSTLKALLIDEVVLIDEEFWQMALSRLSVDGAKMWATFNPGSPAHWFKKTVIDKSEGLGADVYHFTLADNPSLSDTYKERLNAAFTGHTHQRLVEGHWAGATGLIFPIWYKENRPHDHAPGRWHVSIDWASAGVFHALMIKQYTKQNHSYSVAVDELVYDARDAGVTRTEDEHYEALQEFVKPYSRTHTIWVDPATPNSFKRLLRKHNCIVRNAVNDVLPGLVSTASLLKRKQMLISDNCPILQEEMYNYLWDENKEEDAPVKKNDHGCDALRYYCHSNNRVAQDLLNKPLKVKELIGANQRHKRNITR